MLACLLSLIFFKMHILGPSLEVQNSRKGHKNYYSFRASKNIPPILSNQGVLEVLWEEKEICRKLIVIKCS